MDNETSVLKVKAEVARELYRNGKITRKEAEKEITPYLAKVNVRMKELATKYNQKPKLISLTSFLR